MNHEEIFQCYLDDMCPACRGYVDSESNQGHTEYGGKCMAKHFICRHCNSEYTIGFNRLSNPILSEITKNCYELDKDNNTNSTIKFVFYPRTKI